MGGVDCRFGLFLGESFKLCSCSLGSRFIVASTSRLCFNVLTLSGCIRLRSWVLAATRHMFACFFLLQYSIAALSICTVFLTDTGRLLQFVSYHVTQTALKLKSSWATIPVDLPCFTFCTGELVVRCLRGLL